jgi:hypothetical protein
MKVSLADLMEAGIENTDPACSPGGNGDVLKTRSASAIGAAMFPAEANMTAVEPEDIRQMLLQTVVRGSPIGRIETLHESLSRLNDAEKMSREAICQWVRSIEDKHDLYFDPNQEEVPMPKIFA